MITKRNSKGQIERLHKQITTVCPCGESFLTSQDRLDEGRGKFCSKSCMYKYRNAQLEKEHHFWAGDNVSYSGIHHWVKKKYGQDMTCESCGFHTNNKYQIHWANLTGKYLRTREDWARLCAKCHYAFDRSGIQPILVGKRNDTI